MNRLEDQLTDAAEEARRQVTHVEARPASSVRSRMYRHRVLTGAAVAAGVFGLLGATAIVAKTDLTTAAAAPDSATAATATTVNAGETSSPATVAPVEESNPSGLRFNPDPANDDEERWSWVYTVTRIRDPESLPVVEGMDMQGHPVPLSGIREKLLTVQATVPAIRDAMALQSGLGEWSEHAFLLLGDGSDTMVYIGWNELESTDPISAEVWKEFNTTGVETLVITLPDLDTMSSVSERGGVRFLSNVTGHTADYVAETPSILATVRFFQLSDTYGALPIEATPEQMDTIAAEVFEALALERDDSDKAPTVTTTTVVESVDGPVSISDAEFEAAAGPYQQIIPGTAFLWAERDVSGFGTLSLLSGRQQFDGFDRAHACMFLAHDDPKPNASAECYLTEGEAYGFGLAMSGDGCDESGFYRMRFAGWGLEGIPSVHITLADGTEIVIPVENDVALGAWATDQGIDRIELVNATPEQKAAAAREFVLPAVACPVGAPGS
ncbi:MAG: hypothetical protein ABFR89_09805 [Actinomycetota bacterium]